MLGVAVVVDQPSEITKMIENSWALMFTWLLEHSMRRALILNCTRGPHLQVDALPVNPKPSMDRLNTHVVQLDNTSPSLTDGFGRNPMAAYIQG